MADITEGKASTLPVAMLPSRAARSAQMQWLALWQRGSQGTHPARSRRVQPSCPGPTNPLRDALTVLLDAQVLVEIWWVAELSATRL